MFFFEEKELYYVGLKDGQIYRLLVAERTPGNVPCIINLFMTVVDMSCLLEQYRLPLALEWSSHTFHLMLRCNCCYFLVWFAGLIGCMREVWSGLLNWYIYIIYSVLLLFAELKFNGVPVLLWVQDGPVATCTCQDLARFAKPADLAFLASTSGCQYSSGARALLLAEFNGYLEVAIVALRLRQW